MTIRSFFDGAQSTVVGIGIPVIGVLLGVILPIQLAQQSALGKLEATLDFLKADTATIKDKTDRLDARFTNAESDPGLILAKFLGTSVQEANYGVISRVNGRLYAFPRTTDAQMNFAAAGYKLEKIAPTLSGYDMTAGPNVLIRPHDKDPKALLPTHKEFDAAPQQVEPQIFRTP